MLLSKNNLDQRSTNLPAYYKLQYTFFAVCLILGPFLMIVETFFNPSRNAANGSGSAVIAASIAAGTAMPQTYQLSFLIDIAEIFLLPFGFLGMTLLALRRSPWLATIGGFLALSGTTALIVFVGQDVLTHLMAQMGSGPQLVTLWDRFNTDPVITAYLYIFIIGQLLGTLLLGIGLGRTHMIPAWAAWAIILRTPVQIAGFVTHIGLSIEIITYGLLFIGCIPIALALLKSSKEGLPPPNKQ
jgi:hypothetical protein